MQKPYYTLWIFYRAQREEPRTTHGICKEVILGLILKKDFLKTGAAHKEGSIVRDGGFPLFGSFQVDA